MGNGVSTDQGNIPPHGLGDARSLEGPEQHDWSELVTAPNTNSALSADRESYSGAQARGSKSSKFAETDARSDAYSDARACGQNSSTEGDT